VYVENVGEYTKGVRMILFLSRVDASRMLAAVTIRSSLIPLPLIYSG
jgi:hypothetical protein